MFVHRQPHLARGKTETIMIAQRTAPRRLAAALIASQPLACELIIDDIPEANTSSQFISPPATSGDAGEDVSSGGAGGSPGAAGAGLDCDADHDGYLSASLPGCGGSGAGDCDDSNPEVHPTQDAFFSVPYVAPDGSSSFDYDCDAVEQPEQPDLVECSDTGKCRAKTEGFVGQVPACGASGSYADTCQGNFKCSPAPSGKKTQRCR
jgi:hypothetical protein